MVWTEDNPYKKKIVPRGVSGVDNPGDSVI